MNYIAAMLAAEVIKQANAVETLFCVQFEKLKRVPMSRELTEIAIKLMLGNFRGPLHDKPPFVLLIEKRIEHCFTFKVKDQRLTLFLAALTESPGLAVMYLTYLQYWCKKTNTRELDFDTFCERIFPWGFPLESEISKLWDNQKVSGINGTGNLLDYQTALASIQF